MSFRLPKIPIRTKIALIIISVVLIIAASSLGVGVLYVERNFWETVQNDLTVNCELAEKYISAQMELIKRDGQIIANSIDDNTTEEIFNNLVVYYQNNPFFYYEDNPYFSVTVFHNDHWLSYPNFNAIPHDDYSQNKYYRRRSK